MDHFEYQDEVYYSELVDLREVANKFGTPTYVYSKATLERHWHAFNNAFSQHPHLICYAVKANSNIAVLNILAKLGSGFDIVSQGELERVIAAGGSPEKTVFSGVGKTPSEIQRALELNVKCFNVESEAELERIQHIASDINISANVSIRVNPDVDAQTHPYISTGLKENKFGVDIETAFELYQKAAQYSHINLTGIDCHIGSQLTTMSPFLDALDRVLLMVDRLAESGIHIQHIDMGGGLGVTYNDETPPQPSEYAAQILEKMAGRSLEIIIEPGRAIAANAGILLTQVEYLKSNGGRNFAIIDAAMNDLLRPSLYQSWQNILPVVKSTLRPKTYDVVGPVCETGDFLGKQRELAIQQGDLLAIRSAGAYGFSMCSNYNSRNRPAEIMVDQEQTYLIRARESYSDQIKSEFTLP